ncbi:MAG: DUF1501 domain-containing protein [Gemmataceae bacterium]
MTISRRDLMKLSAAGVLGASASGWFELLAARASTTTRPKSCILLWMAGGPAQSHTFDLKPGGDYKSISTSVPGVQVSEHLPKLAKQAQHLAILRSMKTGDGNHRTATYLMHTGFRQGSGGGLVHPSLGAMVASDLGRADFELPNFVAVGNSLGPGHLGPKFAPLVVNDFERGLPDLQPFGGQSETDERATLVEELDKAFLNDYQANSTRAHQAGFQKAIQLMHSGKTKAFELGEEKDSVRDAYGRNKFGQGCLLARRLVEVGVPFVEVTLPGWDTHQGAAQRVKQLSEQLDPGYATLLADLKDRGLLDTTLVIWMGEFGRSPKNGSQHYARAWTSVLAGAGIKAGQAVGATDPTGADVKDHPISSGDFMATVCKALGIDTTTGYVARGGRPMHKVEKGSKPVGQVV